MHDECVPIAQQLTTTAPRAERSSPGLRLSLRALLQRTALDARLARGADPDGAPELALRARQLRSLSTRRPLGRAILSIIERADATRPALSSAIPVSREAIDYARPALIQLAIALRSPEPVRPEGVAQVLTLLRDGAGSLYARETQPSTLYFDARRALLAMRPCSPSSVELVEHGEGR
jgi:hypothetical protein